MCNTLGRVQIVKSEMSNCQNRSRECRVCITCSLSVSAAFCPVAAPDDDDDETGTLSMLAMSSEIGDVGSPHGHVAHASSPSLWKHASRNSSMLLFLFESTFQPNLPMAECTSVPQRSTKLDTLSLSSLSVIWEAGFFTITSRLDGSDSVPE